MKSVYAEVSHLIEEKPDYYCPVCGAENPTWGYYYKTGEFIGCEICIERKSCEDVPEYRTGE